MPPSVLWCELFSTEILLLMLTSIYRIAWENFSTLWFCLRILQHQLSEQPEKHHVFFPSSSASTVTSWTADSLPAQVYLVLRQPAHWAHRIPHPSEDGGCCQQVEFGPEASAEAVLDMEYLAPDQYWEIWC